MICHQLNLIILFWELFSFSGIVSEKTCALKELFSCSEGETCQQLKDSISFGVCKCKNKYFRGPDGVCVKQSDTSHQSLPTAEGVYSQGSSGFGNNKIYCQFCDDSCEDRVSAIVGGLVTAVLLVALAASLVFAAKKYRWVHRVREKAQRFRERHYDTVLVNQEDDPPLA